MQGEFDDILGKDSDQRDYVVTETDPIEKAYNDVLEMEDKDITDDAPEDTYQKSQKRWETEAEVKEELKKRFEEAEKELIKEKLEFEQEYTVDFDDEILKEI